MTWYPEEYLRNLEMTDMGMRSRPSKGTLEEPTDSTKGQLCTHLDMDWGTLNLCKP